MRAIELEGIEVAYGARAVLTVVEQSFQEESFTLIAGPSGSGKSTLLRTIAGLARARAGKLRLFGSLASDGARLDIAPEHRRIGFLFQGGGLWPHLSVRRTLELVLSVRNVPKSGHARRIDELVEWVELRGLEERRPGELSGGEAQRLGLARALACDPKILLLDEPLGPLDARLRKALLQKLGELHDRMRLTTLFVTHDPAEAESIADGRIQMEGGRILR